MADLFTEFYSDFCNLLAPDVIVDVDRVAIAVSGGIDSVALLHLVSRAFKNRRHVDSDKTEIHVLHVNHNLREESAIEAVFVKELAQDYCCQFASYSWNKATKTGNMQAEARKARYGFMIDYCQKNNIRLLLTGHHKDDYIENYIFRKERSDGILALPASYERFLSNIRILRPLSNIYKSQIIQYMHSADQSWREDSSNNEYKYSRNQIRHDLAKLTAEEKMLIEQEMEVITGKASIISTQLVAAIAESVEFTNYGLGIIDLDMIVDLELDIKIPLISHVLNMISGNTKVARSRSLMKILSAIANDQKINCTIHSCRIQQHHRKLYFYKEKAKISTDHIQLADGVVWDNRFRFDINLQYCPESYVIVAIDSMVYAELRNSDSSQAVLATSPDFIQKEVLFTLPMIRKSEKVVAVPHLFYYDDPRIANVVRVLFYPQFISRVTHY